MAASNTDLANGIATRLIDLEEDLIQAWSREILDVRVLKAREDLDSGGPPPELLKQLFSAIIRQLQSPDDYLILRHAVRDGVTEGLTPDATCRFTLGLKRVIVRHLRETAESQDVIEALQGDFDEILVRLAQFTHERRHEEIRTLERGQRKVLGFDQDRLRTLLDTMNEGLISVDNLETITTFNREMERITGYARGEMVGRHIFTLYPSENVSEVREQLGKRRRGESSTFTTHIKHKNGPLIPVRISGAPLHDGEDRHVGSFAVVTDVSDDVIAEARLRQTNEEIARLLDRERKRTAHFSIVNQVAQLALSTLEPDEIFDRVVRAVNSHFSYHHTTLFLVEDGALVMHAQSGAYEPYFSIGYVQPGGEGIVGQVVKTGQPIVANCVKEEPRRLVAFPEEEGTGAELCVPIKIGAEVIGALDVQTQEEDVFDESDLSSLQILADQAAWVIHNAQLYQETLQLKDFSEHVLQHTPLPIILLQPDLLVVSANQSYRDHQDLESEKLIGRPLPEAVPDSFLVTEVGRTALADALKSGNPVTLDRVSVPRGAYQNRTVDIRITRVLTQEGPPLALVVINDITEVIDKAYESSLLRRVVQVMQGILDLDRLLYAILTCVTAGTALRFNRAVLLLVNEEDGVLEGRIGVGPSNREEATRIWRELGQHNPTVDDILAEYDEQPDHDETPLTAAVRGIRIPLDEEGDVLVKSIRERKTFKVTEDDALSISPTLWSALGTHHFVAVPLTTQNKTLGIILADNLYSGAPITEDSVDLLTTFASHAAMALDKAELYHELQEKVSALERTQEELVQSERLAVIGQMSARIAHEIRNPLATIGGFARSISRKPEPDRVMTASAIICDEVTRLENLLRDTLSFTKPAKPVLAPADLNALIEEVKTMLSRDEAAEGVEVRVEPDDHLPAFPMDIAQMKQVCLNIAQNAAQATEPGGSILLRTELLNEEDIRSVRVEVKDTGEGIRAQDLDQIFSPFFTTKTYGTGLGLVISKQIIEDHGGQIDAESRAGEGTVIRITLPIDRKQEGM
jgi:PAS domain S-box-containing protein